MTCQHTYQAMFPDHKTLPESIRYEYWAETKNLWIRNAHICTRCGQTGYLLNGAMVLNWDRKHDYLLEIASRISKRYGIKLPEVKQNVQI